jgi:hypothetical protein
VDLGPVAEVARDFAHVAELDHEHKSKFLEPSVSYAPIQLRALAPSVKPGSVLAVQDLIKLRLLMRMFITSASFLCSCCLALKIRKKSPR